MDPVTSPSNVILRLKLNKFLMSEDGVDEIILSSFNNAVNELKSGKVASFYRFDNPISVVQQLKVFYSYEPKFKHYTVMNGSDLVILRKCKDNLTLHKTYSNVVHYEIADYLNVGKPQIVVHITNAVDPIITDCNVENSSIKLQPKKVPAFAPLIQKSKLRINNAEKMLEEKSKMLSKLSRALAFNCEDDKILTTVNKFVYLREGLVVGDVGLLTKPKVLCVGKSWFKAHCNLWIIGFPINNVSKGRMSSFEMYAAHDCITIKKTAVFIKTSSARDIKGYQEFDTLASGQSGVLVGVIDEPLLISQFLSMKCMCCFETELSPDLEQSYLGTIDITMVDLASHKYKLFAASESVADVVSVQAALKKYDLNFDLFEIDQLQFVETLQTHLNVKQINEFTLINDNFLTSSPQVLIMLNQGHNVLRIYFHSTNDLLLLIHKLVSCFRGKVLFKLASSNTMPALEALQKEISYIKGLLIHELMAESDSDGCQTPPVNFEDATRELMLLEINSMLAVNSLKEM